MKIRAVLAAAAVAAACAGCGASQKQDAARSPAAVHGDFAGSVVPAGTPAIDFTLRDQDGRKIRLGAQRGHIVLLAFLYTHCVDVCPLIAHYMDNAVRSLGPRASSVRILAVSVDPVGDSPKLVREYMRAHHLGPWFHWLVGTHAQLAPVWQDYNILVEGRPADTVVHSAPVLLIDRSGRPRLFYAPPQHQEAFSHDLHELLDA